MGAVTVFAMAGVPLAACGDANNATEKAPLSGRAFVAAEAAGFTLPAGSELRLSFDGLGVRMSGGCNTGSGDYDVQDDLLIVTSMAMTEMACETSLMDLDQHVIDLLTAKPKVTLTDEQLTLTTGATVLRLVDRRVDIPDRELQRTLWTVTTVLNGATATGGFETPATLRLDGARAELFGGCNRGSATAAISATAIEMGVFEMTKVACDQPEMILEFAVLTVLQGSVTYRIAGNQLTVLGREFGLVLEAADE